MQLPHKLNPLTPQSIIQEINVNKYADKILSCATLTFFVGMIPPIAYAKPFITTTQVHAAATSTIQDVFHAINKKANGRHNIVVYQFDSTHPLPQSANGSIADLPISNGWLIAINNASMAGDPEGGQYPISTRIYTDNANASSCKNNANAQLPNGTDESWSVMTPANVLSSLLGKNIFPYILFNANYFDTRTQKNNTTWQINGCTLPLGIFYDNHDHNHTNNQYDASNSYLAGPASYIQADDSQKPLQTYVITDAKKESPAAPSFIKSVTYDLVENKNDNASSTTSFIKSHTQNREEIIAFSGTELLPNMNAATGDSDQGPDSSGKATTRIAIGYNKNNDQLLIFEGGSYQNGVTRDNLQRLFQALGANSALELDGGGSAAVAVQKDKVSWAGASTLAPDDENCHVTNYVCTPVTQPSGSARPVPGWVYFSFPSRGFIVIDGNK